MTSSIPDRYLWLGLGVFIFVAAKQVSAGLQRIHDLTTVHNPRPSSPLGVAPQSSHQEDAIKTSSLLTLATCHNYDIRTSATKILCTRFYANKSARRLLLKDLKSRDEDVRHRAQLALNLLCDLGVWKEGVVAPRLAREEWRVWDSRDSSGPAEGTGLEQRRELRRRRREAVVIHDGEGAFGREDLYMRDEDGTMGSGQDRPVADDMLEDLVRLA